MLTTRSARVPIADYRTYIVGRTTHTLSLERERQNKKTHSSRTETRATDRNTQKQMNCPGPSNAGLSVYLCVCVYRRWVAIQLPCQEYIHLPIICPIYRLPTMICMLHVEPCQTNFCHYIHHNNCPKPSSSIFPQIWLSFVLK